MVHDVFAVPLVIAALCLGSVGCSGSSEVAQPTTTVDEHRSEACASFEDLLAEAQLSDNFDQIQESLRSARQAATRSNDPELAEQLEIVWSTLAEIWTEEAKDSRFLTESELEQQTIDSADRSDTLSEAMDAVADLCRS